MERLAGSGRMIIVRLVVLVGSFLFQISYLNQGIFPPDEGIYSLYSLLVSRGALPYVDFYDNHVPGIYLILGSFFKLFGPSLEVARIAIYILNSLTALLIFEAVSDVSHVLGLLSATLFVLGLPSYLATIVQLEPLVAFLSVASMFFMTKWIESPRRSQVVLSGLLSGYLVLVKQTAIVLPVFQTAYLLLHVVGKPAAARKIWSGKLMVFIVSAVIPPLAFMSFLVATASAGAFMDQAILGNLYVTLPYLSQPPPPATCDTLQQLYLPLIPIVLGISVGMLIRNLKPLAGACASLLVLTFPRFHTLHLYASFALAIILLGKGIGYVLEPVHAKRGSLSRKVRVVAMLIILTVSSSFIWAASLNLTSSKIPSDPNVYLAAEFVRGNTSQHEAIFSLPYRAEIYFLADRMFPLGGPGILLPGVSQDDTILRMRGVRLVVYSPNDAVRYIKAGVTVDERMSEYAPKVHDYIETEYAKVEAFGNFLMYVRNGQGVTHTSSTFGASVEVDGLEPERQLSSSTLTKFVLDPYEAWRPLGEFTRPSQRTILVQESIQNPFSSSLSVGLTPAMCKVILGCSGCPSNIKKPPV